MQKGISTYTVYARFFPAIISALPLFVLWYFGAQDVQLREFGAYLVNLKFYGGVSLSLVSLYFYAHVIRVTSKWFENRYFVKAAGFPTTYLMTYADSTFSNAYKDRYRAEVRKQFDLVLPTEEEESRDPRDAAQRLSEVTKHVILKVGAGQLVLKHNVWYGFFRNLIGGTLYSMTFCVVNVLVGSIGLKNALLVYSSAVLLLLYGVVFLLRKPILVQNAESYARQLIAEFISLG